MKNTIIAIIVIVVVAGGIWWYMNGTPGATSSANKIIVPLATQNASGQSGKATLEEITQQVAGVDKKVVRLTIKLSGASDAAEPAHIHLGACANIGQPVFPLTSVIKGVSVTDIDTTLDQIKASTQPLSINVHKSEAEISAYVACGDVPLAVSQGTPATQ